MGHLSYLQVSVVHLAASGINIEEGRRIDLRSGDSYEDPPMHLLLASGDTHPTRTTASTVPEPKCLRTHLELPTLPWALSLGAR